VFQVAEYRALWSAQLLSLIGDQLAIVALTWLVFDRSDSPLLAAITYAISFLPWLVGGPLLSGIADRWPRRELMVGCDLVRAVLMLGMAVFGLPIWALCCLLFCTELLAPPFGAARAAVLPEILTRDRYVVGTAIGNITNQAGQVLGFGVGGLIVGFLHPTVALGVNAATFGLSAALLALGLKRRDSARPEPVSLRSMFADAASGARLLFGRPELRILTGFGLLCIWYVVPEGLVTPYAAEIGAGATGAGLLLAAIPGGAVLGAAVLSRWVSPPRRLTLMGPLAIGTCAPLLLFGFRPGLGWSVLILAASGAASSYQLAANAAFVIAVPPDLRGQAFGLIQALMSVGQGLAIVAAGALAQFAGSTWVIVSAGGAGCLVAAVLALGWRASDTG
jgi:Major Facilitator Superfamily